MGTFFTKKVCSSKLKAIIKLQEYILAVASNVVQCCSGLSKNNMITNKYEDKKFLNPKLEWH